MSSDQLDFVTYCIGNLSIRLQLPQHCKNKFVLQSRLKYLFDPSIFIMVFCNLMALYVGYYFQMKIYIF